MGLASRPAQDTRVELPDGCSEAPDTSSLACLMAVKRCRRLRERRKLLMYNLSLLDSEPSPVRDIRGVVSEGWTISTTGRRGDCIDRYFPQRVEGTDRSSPCEARRAPVGPF